MYCENCGAALPDGARFCERCGTAIRAEAPSPPRPANRATGKRAWAERPAILDLWPLAVLLALAAVAILGVLAATGAFDEEGDGGGTTTGSVAPPLATIPITVVPGLASPGPEATVSPPPAPTGAISGALSYPSDHIPPQRIVAINVEDGGISWVDTQFGQSTYVLGGLQPGAYLVVAYVRREDVGIADDLAAGFTVAVPCGLSVECDDHRLIEVTVGPGERINGVDPVDWYAPTGAFPPDPTS